MQLRMKITVGKPRRSYEESKDSFDHNGRITVDVKQIGNRPAGSQAEGL